jgi:iron-sulfur cluster assembly protein CyaY
VDEKDHSNISTALAFKGFRRGILAKGLTGALKMLSEQEFRTRSDEAFQTARQNLLPLADEEGFEIELQNGVLDLVFEEPRETKFVVSPNAPVRQIWVSAMSKSYKLAWDSDREVFALNGEALVDLLRRLTEEFLERDS